MVPLITDIVASLLFQLSTCSLKTYWHRPLEGRHSRTIKHLDRVRAEFVAEAIVVVLHPGQKDLSRCSWIGVGRLTRLAPADKLSCLQGRFDLSVHWVAALGHVISLFLGGLVQPARK